MAAEQPSFNLSQAVLLYAYELSKDRVTPLVDRRFLTPTGNWRQLRKELEEVLKCLGGQSIPAEGSRRLLADLVLLPGRHLGTLHNLVRLVSARLVSEPRPRLDLDDKISEDNI